MSRKPPDSKPDPDLEDGDFYFNKAGLMVLTEKYLLKRGFCCENACLHCPYGFKKPL